jgi:hypothetical protein
LAGDSFSLGAGGGGVSFSFGGGSGAGAASTLGVWFVVGGGSTGAGGGGSGLVSVPFTGASVLIISAFGEGFSGAGASAGAASAGAAWGGSSASGASASVIAAFIYKCRSKWLPIQRSSGVGGRRWRPGGFEPAALGTCGGRDLGQSMAERKGHR